jgi:hypothetical protein
MACGQFSIHRPNGIVEHAFTLILCEPVQLCHQIHGTAPQTTHSFAAKLPSRRHLSGACQGTIEGCACVAGSSIMMTDLQTRVEKYEIKAAQCEEWVRQAGDARERAFYEVLAGYYCELAKDFRKVIEKRKIA